MHPFIKHHIGVISKFINKNQFLVNVIFNNINYYLTYVNYVSIIVVLHDHVFNSVAIYSIFVI